MMARVSCLPDRQVLPERVRKIIGGGAEQLFGKQKGRSMDALFEKLTKISAVAFMVIAVLLLIIRRFF